MTETIVGVPMSQSARHDNSSSKLNPINDDADAPVKHQVGPVNPAPPEKNDSLLDDDQINDEKVII